MSDSGLYKEVDPNASSTKVSDKSDSKEDAVPMNEIAKVLGFFAELFIPSILEDIPKKNMNMWKYSFTNDASQRKLIENFAATSGSLSLDEVKDDPSAVAVLRSLHKMLKGQKKIAANISANIPKIVSCLATFVLQTTFGMRDSANVSQLRAFVEIFKLLQTQPRAKDSRRGCQPENTDELNKWKTTVETKMCAAVFQLLDADGNGEIGFDEFISYVSKFLTEASATFGFIWKMVSDSLENDAFLEPAFSCGASLDTRTPVSVDAVIESLKPSEDPNASWAPSTGSRRMRRRSPIVRAPPNPYERLLRLHRDFLVFFTQMGRNGSGKFIVPLLEKIISEVKSKYGSSNALTEKDVSSILVVVITSSMDIYGEELVKTKAPKDLLACFDIARKTLTKLLAHGMFPNLGKALLNILARKSISTSSPTAIELRSLKAALQDAKDSNDFALCIEIHGKIQEIEKKEAALGATLSGSGVVDILSFVKSAMRDDKNSDEALDSVKFFLKMIDIDADGTIEADELALLWRNFIEIMTGCWIADALLLAKEFVPLFLKEVYPIMKDSGLLPFEFPITKDKAVALLSPIIGKLLPAPRRVRRYKHCA